MVTLMQFGQEVTFTSGGPRIAVGKQGGGKSVGKVFSSPSILPLPSFLTLELDTAATSVNSEGT